VADREPTGELERRAVSLAARVVDLAAERDALAETIDRIAPAVAPNLAEMAGAELAARLIALAGGLEPLAKKPSGTLQVLGAEDALFAHLSGRAPRRNTESSTPTSTFGTRDPRTGDRLRGHSRAS